MGSDGLDNLEMTSARVEMLLESVGWSSQVTKCIKSSAGWLRRRLEGNKQKKENTHFQKHVLPETSSRSWRERERECGFAPSKEQENTLTQWRVLHSPSGWWRSRIRTRQTQGSPTRWASSPRSFAWLCAVHQKTQQGVTGGVCVVGVWLGGWTTGQRLNQAG